MNLFLFVDDIHCFLCFIPHVFLFGWDELKGEGESDSIVI